jgi:hypothetical protein
MPADTNICRSHKQLEHSNLRAGLEHGESRTAVAVQFENDILAAACRPISMLSEEQNHGIFSGGARRLPTVSKKFQ